MLFASPRKSFFVESTMSGFISTIPRFKPLKSEVEGIVFFDNLHLHEYIMLFYC